MWHFFLDNTKQQQEVYAFVTGRFLIFLGLLVDPRRPAAAPGVRGPHFENLMY